MNRPPPPTSPLSNDSNDSLTMRYGNMGPPSSGSNSIGGTPNDIAYQGGPYGATQPGQRRPPPQPRASPPGSQHPSTGTDVSRPSGAASSRSTSMNRAPSSASSMGMSNDGRMGGPGRNGGPLPGRDRDRDSSKSNGFRPESEEQLGRHYGVLKHYLAAILRDEQGNPKPNRARDKLLRLSVTQFMELSTDVYDELIRREDDRLKRVREVPKYLLPRPNFHPKRNQARQKLSTLPIERFRQLATDVFYELERRIPRFAVEDIDRPASTASSARGPSRNGMRPPVGPPGSGFRGPPPAGGRGPPPPLSPTGGPNGMGPPQPGYQSFRGNSPGPGGPPPAGRPRAPTNGSEGGSFGRPLPKTFAQNTIVPNKSTMVEEDESGDEADQAAQRGSDAFALDNNSDGKVLSGVSQYSMGGISSVLNSAGQGNEKDRETIKAQETEITSLKTTTMELREMLEQLESRVLEKDSELEKARTTSRDREVGVGNERNEWHELRKELEQKLQDANRLQSTAQTQNEDLQRQLAELDKLQLQNEDQAAELDNLHAQTDTLHAQLTNLQRENADLRKQPAPATGNEQDRERIELLERELEQQAKLTTQVREEATLYLREMRDLAQSNDAAVEREEKLAHRITHLETQNGQWRERCARVRALNKNLRASTLGLQQNGHNLLSSESQLDRTTRNALITPTGRVHDVQITAFQTSISDLLRNARAETSDPAETESLLLESLKPVIIAVQAISASAVADSHTDNSSTSQPQNSSGNVQILKLRARVTGTANSLITATKQHAASAGLSPIALLDAAASNLSAGVVELVKNVGVLSDPSGPSNTDDDDDDADDDDEGEGYVETHTPLPRRRGLEETLQSFYDDRNSVASGGALDSPGFLRVQAAGGDGGRVSVSEVKPAPLKIGGIGGKGSANGNGNGNSLGGGGNTAAENGAGWSAGWTGSARGDEREDSPVGQRGHGGDYDPYRQ
ncbi:hypothetical protein MBLNU230_g3546t1 [Neophaeotheca triangularis]